MAIDKTPCVGHEFEPYELCVFINLLRQRGIEASEFCLRRHDRWFAFGSWTPRGDELKNARSSGPDYEDAEADQKPQELIFRTVRRS